MCGICGELRMAGEGRVSANELRRMRDTLVHRGSDDAGMYVSPDGAVGLGFRRLSIIDLTSNANQPMANEDGTVHIVFNGEIYNYRQLRRGLSADHRFRSQADTEVIVHLYEELGVSAIARLEGMFAIAIWDERAQQLLLARDRAGKKPLFYQQRGNRFAFASEIKAFFAVPELVPEPDPAAFPVFFMHGAVPWPCTLYRGVQQVAPGSFVTVSRAGSVAGERYWHLNYASRAQLSRGCVPPRAEVVAEVRRLTERAVERRLVSDVPIGAFLSGGIDSSVVVGIMSRMMTTPVRTFSIGFTGDARYDETSYARSVAERFATAHTEFRVSPSAVGLVEKLVWHHDGPFGDASAIPTFIVSNLTRQHVTVALSGDGGDELFGGYDRFAAALMAERIPSPLRRVLAVPLSWLPAPASSRHLIARAKRFGEGIRGSAAERVARWSGLFYDDVELLFNADWRAALMPIDRLPFLRQDASEMESLSPLGQILYLNFQSYLVDDLLVKVDRCSMANSLEVRSPLLDRELTEYVATLPDEYKIDGWNTKVILREAFQDLLPPAVCARPKMGFGVPLDAWFRGELREHLRAMLLGADARYPEYLSRPRIEALLRSHDDGRMNIGLQLWMLLTFEVWLRLMAEWSRGALARYAQEASNASESVLFGDDPRRSQAS